jgi:hypothetical protein
VEERDRDDRDKEWDRARAQARLCASAMRSQDRVCRELEMEREERERERDESERESDLRDRQWAGVRQAHDIGGLRAESPPRWVYVPYPLYDRVDNSLLVRLGLEQGESE